MRTKFIHDKFELDVSHLALSWTEENSWFKDEFFLTSSFPFEIDFDENRYFQFFRHHNLSTPETYYQGKLEKDGKIEDAILEVEETGEKLRLTIRYGVEALPNWTKKLSELELDFVLPNGGNMRSHANTMVDKTWPEVNYNFPAVHSEYYKDSPMFANFQGVINKRVAGEFISNIADGSETHNRNIVYPFPYHLYVLKSAIEDAGYTLHGDVLSDPDLLSAIIVPPKALVNFEGIPHPINWQTSLADRIWYFHAPPFWFEQWESTQEINFRGSFHLSGLINDEVKNLKIKLNDTVLFSFTEGDVLFFNFWFETTEENNVLGLKAFSLGNGLDTWVINADLETLYLTDEHGEMLPFLADFSNVQLAAKLPDMTVGDFIKFHKLIKNYDFDLRNNNEIWMNLVQNEVINAEVVNISEYDVKHPTRKFEQAKSFLLHYEEDSEKFKSDKIYSDKTGYFINDFTKAENTAEITINGIPLPVGSILSPNESEESQGDMITTAVQITDDASKLQLVKYTGLINGENWTKEMNGLKTLNLYLNYHQRWLNFMIHAIKFSWTIKDYPNLLIKINRKSKLFAFNNFLFVHTLNRQRQKNIEEIEVEAYSSKV